ncbi:caspase family protein [Cellulomonas sp. P5_C5]
MTLGTDRKVAGAAVHVLAIGVGTYRHLPGGPEPVDHGTLDLDQLDGPPRSVQQLTAWLETSLSHPTAPLGTIEMLASDLPGVERASMANVRDAFDRWYARCDTDPGNVSVLYFCGHGVERESQFILLDDFGRSATRLLDNAVDITATHAGMARCAAREQYVFVDACRSIPFQLVKQLSGTAAALVDRDVSADRRRHSALVFAVAGGHSAFGQVGGVTQFTAALLRALDGLGARQLGRSWVVDVPTTLSAITQLLDGTHGGPAQVPTVVVSGTGVLHRLPRAPVVPVSLQCTPTDAVARATATLSSLTALIGTQAADDRPARLEAVPTGWSGEAPAGTYALRLDFADHSYPTYDAPVYAHPPGVFYDPIVLVP